MSLSTVTAVSSARWAYLYLDTPEAGLEIGGLDNDKGMEDSCLSLASWSVRSIRNFGSQIQID